MWYILFASVERIFSAMNIIKADLRNKVSNESLNDLMVCYTKRDIFRSIDDDAIIKSFQGMKNRRMICLAKVVIQANILVIVTYWNHITCFGGCTFY